MEKHNPRERTAAKLEALIQAWGWQPGLSPVDKFFPVRFWYITCVVTAASVWLLFNSPHIAQTLTEDPVNLTHLQGFLYFRGWFLAGVMALGCYAYFWNWYPATVFSAYLLLGVTNLVFDLFTVYPERLAKPQPFFVLLLLVRLSTLWVLYTSVKNMRRLPAQRHRASLLLPFRADT